MDVEVAPFLLRLRILNLMDSLKLIRTDRTFKAENRPSRQFAGRRTFIV